MVNSSALSGNDTESRETLYQSKFVYIAGIAEMIVVILLILCFCIFVCFNALILNVYFTTPHVHEHARYVLFVHMLITDILYLIASISLFLVAIYAVYIPMPICYPMLNLAALTFRITACNLAIMALERYVAICYPLQYFQFCNAHRANTSIILMWVVGAVPNVADFFAMQSTVEQDFFSRNVICDLSLLAVNPLQNTIRTLTFISTFTLVALTIVFTYIKVMQVAKKAGSGTSSASKAGRTVMMHALQLLLCMTAFISTVSETYLRDSPVMLLITNFLVFTCLPRFLSPVIYGVRDEVFHKYIRTFCLFNL
ncbi:odorant receptor 131-2-like [Pelobates fuscus]|uniref:odorant receptor 131-2-like n=1 Tax=Pelobates fuscus TaxID=191477 RepID=UPI002FE4B442